jgi:hypothetical protein
MLQQLFGVDLPVPVRFAIAFFVVMIVIVGVSAAARFLIRQRKRR